MVARPVEEIEQSPPADSVEFIFEYAKGFPELQNKDWEAMETKATQVLTAGSFIVGLASIGSMGPQLRLEPGQAVLFALGLAAYLGVLGCVAAAIRVRDIHRSRLVDWAWDNRDADPHDLRVELIGHIKAAYAHNIGEIDKKAAHIQRAMVALGLEAVCITVALIWTRLA
jgi:hypothetical protein